MKYIWKASLALKSGIGGDSFFVLTEREDISEAADLALKYYEDNVEKNYRISFIGFHGQTAN